jgi:hypothetical protein
MDLVPEEVAPLQRAPIAHQDDHVVVAMAQPENVFALDDLRVLTELPVFPVMAEPQQISAAISRCYGTVVPAAAVPATDAGVAANGAGTNGTAPQAPSPLPDATEASGDTRQPHLSPSLPPLPEEDGDHPPRQRALRAGDPPRDGRPASKPSPTNCVRFRADGLLREVSDAPCRRCVR